RAYAEIANEKCMTITSVPGHWDRAYVPDHWREAATERALSARDERPERVTLTDEEETLASVIARGANVTPAQAEHELSPSLAAREQALREKIAGEIEAEARPPKAMNAGKSLTLHAKLFAYIARGGAR